MKPIFQLITTAICCVGISQIGYAQTTTYEVKNCEKINTEYNEIHAIPVNSGVMVYTSTKRKDPLLICKDDEIDDQYADLYYAEKIGDNYQGNTLLHQAVNQKHHNAVPTFSPDKKTMLFSRTDPDKNLKVLKLYSAKKVGGKWQEVEELPFNSNDFSNLHPTFSPDGKQVIFASTRNDKPDAPDLYIVDYQDGKWGEPKLLGGNINTKGIEYFPHWASDNKLYFASDGHKGKGGLDVFYATQLADDTWSEPVHLPAPINTKADDFAFVPMNESSGFMASNRKGGKGQDDLYIWTSIQQGTPVDLSVIHAETTDMLGNATIHIMPMLEDINAIGQIDDGLLNIVDLTSKKKKPLEYLVLPGAMYKITVNKEGFLPYEIEISGAELVEKGALVADLSPVQKFITITVFAEDKLEDRPIEGAKIKVLNKCTDKVETFTTNAFGEIITDIDCACDYTIMGQKDSYEPKEMSIYSKTLKCDGTDDTKMTITLRPVMKKGKVITLENIYYDYDKADILPQAATELDKVVTLMKEYSTMEIELSSHTDSRGNDAYNLQLSQRRADSAVAYIVSKGIDNQRITAKGYGETNLVNGCTNGIQCEDEEHQKNRRTVVSITELVEGDVRIEYKNGGR